MKIAKIPCVLKLDESNIVELFRFLNKICDNYSGDIILDFTNLRKKECCGGVRILIAIYIEMYNNKTQKIIQCKSMPKDFFNIDGALFKVNESQFEKLSYEDISKFNPLILSRLIKNLNRIGINPKNRKYSEQYERVKAILTEMIGNALEHGKMENNLNYHIASEYNNRNKTVTFFMVDLGVGIAKSQRAAKHKIWHRFMSDSYLVKKTFIGEIPSSTKENNRGRGLPEILDAIKQGIIEDFILISNGSALYYKEGKIYTKRIKNFVGTYYSWTVKNKNYGNNN